MRKITKIRRSIKAISPVISVLLMIAIAVVASLVVYAWIMGYIGGTTTKAGQAIQIQSYAPGVDNQHVVIYVQNIGQGSVDLSQSGSVYINDQGVPIDSSVTIAVGETKAIIADLTGTSLTWIPGEQIKIKVVTNDGTFMQASGTGAGGSSGTPVIVHTITASADSNGQITPFGQVPVNDGASLAFSITANTGYQIADVLVDGVSQGAISSYTFTNVVADHSISVSFTAITFTITVSAGSGGSIDPVGPSVSVNYGADQAFSITAGSGYHIVDVLVDGASQGAISSYTFTNVQADHEISATFALTIVQHKVSFAQTGSGSTVTVSYQIDGGSVQTGTAPFDIMVTEGHTISYTYPGTIAGATGVRYSLTNTNPASPQTMGSSDISVSGTYKTQYQVTFAVSGSGTINPSGTNVWEDAGSLAISATANSGNHFTSWSATTGITITSPTTTPTTATIGASGTITANFAANTPVTITLRPNAAGSTTQLNAQGSGTANWDRVDEVTADGATTYVRGTGDDTWQSDTYNIPDQTLSGTITNVRIYIVALESTSRPSDTYGRTAICIGTGSIQYGTQLDLTTSWASYYTDYATKTGNLGTGDWTWTNINNLQIGVGLQSHDSSGTMRYAECTQVWVEITYIPA